MLILDGSAGEGGGQILRTSLTLSLITGTPFTLEHIRAGRTQPGLRRQHLAAIHAAAQIGGAEVSGAALDSRAVSFNPRGVRAGEYLFRVGSAGSATLVLQTVLPALLGADARSVLVLEGGTHNPWAPPYDFLEKAFLPLLGRMGARVSSRLERRGFYPAGGGRFRVDVEPCPRLERLDLLTRGAVRATRATAVVSRLSGGIARRELDVLERELGLDPRHLHRIEDQESPGPGNAVFVEIESEQLTEVFTEFGQKNLSAETVAGQLARAVQAYLHADAPVGEHLADQLLLPLALAGGGSFVSTPLSGHATTNMDLISRFLPRNFAVDRSSQIRHRVDVS